MRILFTCTVYIYAQKLMSTEYHDIDQKYCINSSLDGVPIETGNSFISVIIFLIKTSVKIWHSNLTLKVTKAFGDAIICYVLFLLKVQSILGPSPCRRAFLSWVSEGVSPRLPRKWTSRSRVNRGPLTVQGNGWQV